MSPVKYFFSYKLLGNGVFIKKVINTNWFAKGGARMSDRPSTMGGESKKSTSVTQKIKHTKPSGDLGFSIFQDCEQ